METIEFRLVEVDRPAVLGTTVLPHVDGVALTELARAVELPLARAQDRPDLAGSYAGLLSAEVAWPSRHFLGAPATEFELESDALERFGEADRLAEACGAGPRTVLLGCECGLAMCWPLAARVALHVDRVTWSDFRHGFRDWDLAPLGPSTFDRSQYEETLCATAR